jgi:cytochrome c oxidase subunit IV
VIAFLGWMFVICAPSLMVGCFMGKGIITIMCSMVILVVLTMGLQLAVGMEIMSKCYSPNPCVLLFPIVMVIFVTNSVLCYLFVNY